MNNIPIFLSSDNNYAPFVATTIASICDNTKSFCEFYVLDGGIAPKNRTKIENLKNQFDNFSLEFVNVDENLYFKNFITNNYITVATYYRFIIPQLFSNLEKFLYLDVDIIVNSDVSQLFNENLENFVLGAVKDFGNKYYIKKLKYNVGIKRDHVYFNAGVLLIDNQKWNKENITEKLFKIEERYRGKLECNDQDVLNKCFENNYKILHQKYNSRKNENDTVIRHFYQDIKPWHIHPDVTLGNNLLPDFEIFWKYAKLTPFYNDLLKNCKHKTNHEFHLHLLYKKLAQQKTKTSVSIIIPIYNAEKYLRKCLDTVSNQSMLDIEIICIDDSSTDNSLEILKEYAGDDDRIKIIEFKKNKGAASARNEGIKIAKGEYIGFVDSDDYIDPDFYEKLYNKAKENYSDLVIGNWYEVKSNNSKKDAFDIVKFAKINKLNYNQLFTLGLYKKELLEQNNIKFIENCSYGEDRLLPLMASYYSKNFSVVEDTFYYYYRGNANSATKSKMTAKKIDDFLCSLNVIFNFINEIDITEENYKVVADVFIDNAYSICCATDNKNKEDYILKLCAAFQNLKYYDDLKKLFCANNIKQIICHITKSYNKKIFDNLRKNLKIKDDVKC